MRQPSVPKLGQPPPSTAPNGTPRAFTARIRVDAEMCRCGFLFVQPSFARDVGLEPETGPLPPPPLTRGPARGPDPPAALSVPVVDSASGSWIYAVLRQGAPAPTALTTAVGPAPPGAVAPARLCGLGAWMARKGVAPGSVVRLTCAKGGQLSLAVERQTGQLSSTAAAGEGALGAGQGQGLQQGPAALHAEGPAGGGQGASHFAQHECQQGYGGPSGALGDARAGAFGEGRGPGCGRGHQQPLQEGQGVQGAQGVQGDNAVGTGCREGHGGRSAAQPPSCLWAPGSKDGREGSGCQR